MSKAARDRFSQNPLDGADSCTPARRKNLAILVHVIEIAPLKIGLHRIGPVGRPGQVV